LEEEIFSSFFIILYIISYIILSSFTLSFVAYSNTQLLWKGRREGGREEEREAYLVYM